MSRLYGRIDDIYNISKYLNNNYNKKYKKDMTCIDAKDLEDAPLSLSSYLPNNVINFLNKKEITICYNPLSRFTSTIIENDEPTIIYPSSKIREEYKRELIYFIGDILKNINLDLLPDKFDLKCQYASIVPLLLEYIYLKEENKIERFSEKYLSELKENAKDYIRLYDKYHKNENKYDIGTFLMASLTYLVPFASFDACLQVTDKYISDKEKMKELLKELIENPQNNRENIMLKHDIDTYGFKRLRKEIELRK